MLTLLPCGLLAQQPLNLDFERKSVEGAKRPWGWSSLTWGSHFEMDSTTVKTGNYSLHSKCRDQESPCNNQSLAYSFEVYELTGKEITISGFVKTKKAVASTGISVRYTLLTKETEEFSFGELHSRKLSGTFNWQKVTITLKVPESVTQFSLNLHQDGLGEVWYDDFTLSIENKTVKQLNAAEAFSNKNIDWLSNHVHSFNSPLPAIGTNPIPSKDLSFFKDAVGDSKIVGLGESTHGTSEFFSLKHKLLQYAVTELGFRVFVLEDHFMAGEDINAFVTNGTGTLREAIKGIFATWNTAEVHKMIQWIRNYNQAHADDLIYFVGVDIQEVTRPIDSLLYFIKRQDSLYFEKTELELKELREVGARHYMIQDTLVRMSWIDKSESIYTTLLANKEKWLQTATSNAEKTQIEYGVQYANIVQQYFKEIYSFGSALYRDEAMAENISWYFEKIHPNKKMIVWAHDSHVSRGDHDGIFTNLNNGVTMGSFLSKKYKNNYKSFGLATYQGNYLAFKTYAYQVQIQAPLFPSPVGSLEEALHQIAQEKKCENLYLSLPRSIDWLNKPLPLRFANHVSIDYGYWGRLVVPCQFDGLFFIDNTTSAKNNSR